MKKSPASPLLALLTLSVLILGLRAEGADFGLSVTSSPNPVGASNAVLYIIDLTNTSGTTLAPVWVTNTASASVFIDAYTNNLSAPVVVTTNSNALIFQIESLTNDGAAQLQLLLAPTSVGSFTNTVTVGATNATSVTTNVVTEVIIIPVADLAVFITGLATNVLVNDYMTFGVTVTNLGPETASNVVLTIFDSGGLIARGFTPTNQTSIVTNGLNVGTFTSHAFRDFKFTFQPTNAGTLTLMATVSATSMSDPNLTNNVTTHSTGVQPFLPGLLVASTVSTQKYNPQTGLMEQTIRLSNVGTNDVASAMVIVSGMTNRLYNAVGTNGYNTGADPGNPYVVCGAPLAVGESVDLLLEYFVPARQPVPDPALTALEIAAVDLSAPLGTPLAITRWVNLGADGLLIEFQSITNRSYTVLYSDNPSFSNELAAQPAIVAQADRVQWIDDGPPKTVSRPTVRFYRVLLNP